MMRIYGISFQVNSFEVTDLDTPFTVEATNPTNWKIVLFVEKIVGGSSSS